MRYCANRLQRYNFFFTYTIPICEDIAGFQSRMFFITIYQANEFVVLFLSKQILARLTISPADEQLSYLIQGHETVAL